MGVRDHRFKSCRPDKEMKKYILRIRGTDKFVFDSIKKGDKRVETRAATDRYRRIKEKDVLVFVCGNERIEKKVKKVSYFKDIDEMIKKIDFKKIMPFVSSSVEEMKSVCYSFSGYREKIKKFGLVAFEI